jgi:hypothetical protein
MNTYGVEVLEAWYHKGNYRTGGAPFWGVRYVRPGEELTDRWDWNYAAACGDSINDVLAFDWNGLFDQNYVADLVATGGGAWFVWSASQDRLPKAPKCECGAHKTYGPKWTAHTNWCPLHV